MFSNVHDKRYFLAIFYKITIKARKLATRLQFEFFISFYPSSLIF